MPAVNYLWDPFEDNVVREFNEAGSAVADYTTEPALYGNLVSQRREESRFFHFDGVGSTVALTNEGQQETDARAYSAFGTITEETGGTEFLFQYIGKNGYYRDVTLGTLTIRRRSYWQGAARWLSADPTARTLVLIGYAKRSARYLHQSPWSNVDAAYYPVP